MIAFPDMLVSPAAEAGIPTPPDANEYTPEEFPQFHLFCCAQLGRPMPNPVAHWGNAEIIKQIEPEDCKLTTMSQLEAIGFR